MSDRIAVMNRGCIEQLGISADVYEHPRTRFAAQFLGSCNLLVGTVMSREGSTVFAQTGVGIFKVECTRRGREANRDERLTLAIRPEKVMLNAAGPVESSFRARIEEAVYCGAETQYLLRSGEQTLKARLMNTRAAEPGLRVGQEVNVHLPPAGLIVLDD